MTASPMVKAAVASRVVAALGGERTLAGGIVAGGGLVLGDGGGGA